MAKAKTAKSAQRSTKKAKASVSKAPVAKARARKRSAKAKPTGGARPAESSTRATRTSVESHASNATQTPRTDTLTAAEGKAEQVVLSGLYRPLVRGAQHARTANVRTIQSDASDGRLAMADFQRCAHEWDLQKKSLLIESIVANYPIPPITVWPQSHDMGQIDLVLDGQQRISTILSYLDDDFACLPIDKAPYDGYRISQHIAGRTFSELAGDVRKHIMSYKLSFCVLPESLNTEDRLRIFALMNQGGVALSAHDLRLALFGESARVHFIRLAGIYDSKEESCARMLSVGERKYGLSYPWQEPSHWRDWWQCSRFATGQYPSEMFLFFLMCRISVYVDQLLQNLRVTNHLGVRLSDTVSSTLDILCAQFEAEDKQTDPINRLPDLAKLRDHFESFESWFNAILSRKIAVRTGSSRKLALIMAAAAECWTTPSRVDNAWSELEFVLTQGPRAISERFGEYPSVRGKWLTQRRQIARVNEIVAAIAGKSAPTTLI